MSSRNEIGIHAGRDAGYSFSVRMSKIEKSGFHRQCFILAVYSTVQVFNIHRMGQTLRRLKPIHGMHRK